MGSVDDKGCYNPTTKSYNIKFTKGKKASHGGGKALNSRPKPAPSKWDDAQKWLVGLSGGGHHDHHSKTKPRNSNAEDRRLLAPMPQRGRDSCSSMDDRLEDDLALAVSNRDQDQEEGEITKKVDCSESTWGANKQVEELAIGVRSVSLRDMGTEMTPIASKEPSRAGTPLRARSPISSRASSPGRCRLGAQHVEITKNFESSCGSSIVGTGSSLESRARAWDEAERTRFMARYKREEVKIQAWENSMTRKAEMELNMMEAKAERMKCRAQEKLASKIASTRRRAEERRSGAKAKLNKHAAKASERAEYVSRAGHLPSSFFSFKLPSLCG